jgi:16S rRNA (uracil1498-N3)-methyltransferase
VAAIQPFEATRSEHGLAQAAVKRLARWEKIAVEASQQSRRRYLPRIEPVIKFTRAIEQKFLVRFLLDETPDAPPVLQLVPGGKRAEDRVALLLGPEGGWTVEERTQAQAAGWQSCSLGRTVLRSETAALAALAVVQAAWADAAVVAG